MAEPLTDSPPRPSIPEIIQRYLNGESIQTIAADARVARRTIYKWMHRIGDQHYYDLVTDALVVRLADADHALATAETMGHIARAREEARYTRWDLERRRPHAWGPKQEVKSEQTITIQVQRYLPPHEEAEVLELTPQPVDITPKESA